MVTDGIDAVHGCSLLRRMRKFKSINNQKRDRVEILPGSHVVTHSSRAEFTKGVVFNNITTDKDKSYPHQSLQPASHLWCDVVHASDADVRKGNR